MAATDTAVARRYAQAILELAVAHNNLDQWRGDLQTMSDIWRSTPVAVQLDDPKRGRSRRMEEARGLLQGRVNPLAVNLALLLVRRGRAGLVPVIARQFERIERDREGRVTAQVTSAIALTDAQRANLRDQLGRRSGKTVDLDERVDPSIMGGLVVRIGDELIDASIAGRLRRIQAQLTSS
jgi:F-type H+-transporting ATPase subunit delta